MRKIRRRETERRKGRKERAKRRKQRNKQTNKNLHLVLHSKLQLWNTFFPIILFSCAQSSPFSFPLTSWPLTILSLVENASLPPPPEQASAGMVTPYNVCVWVCVGVWVNVSGTHLLPFAAKCCSSSVLMLLGRGVKENSEYNQTYPTLVVVFILSIVISSLTSCAQVSGLWHQPGHAGSYGHRGEFLGSHCKASQLHSSPEESWLYLFYFISYPQKYTPKVFTLRP